MFSSLRLFSELACPQLHSPHGCTRGDACLFSHRAPKKIPTLPGLHLITEVPRPVLAKRPASPEPEISRPRKILKTGPAPLISRPVRPPKAPVASTSQLTPTGPPILQVKPFESTIPVTLRQSMLTALFNAYNDASAGPAALSREADVYKSTGKQKNIYRNAMISAISSVKTAPKPPPAPEKPKYISLTTSELTPLLLTPEQCTELRYITHIPQSEGSSQSTSDGLTRPCARAGCSLMFLVTSTPPLNQCTFHWGRLQTRIFKAAVGGGKYRAWSCCGVKDGDGLGCETGAHVFSETDPKILHEREAFTSFPEPKPSASRSALDIIAMDCEMIHTTAGSTVARVSVVTPTTDPYASDLDTQWEVVFDELIQLPRSVVAIDYLTRFSGLTAAQFETTETSKPLLPLPLIKEALSALVDQDTIIMGHALENDLKALRIVHNKVIDTVMLFPHRAGMPYRRALRDIVQEHLGLSIQQGDGKSGHSSVEDARAVGGLLDVFCKSSAYSQWIKRQKERKLEEMDEAEIFLQYE